MSTAEFSAESELPQALPAGEQLAAARANRGLSITEIAQHLKLSPWQVEALEAGDHRRLPSPVFVRGFIRNYARLVKLDPGDCWRAQTASHRRRRCRAARSVLRRKFPIRSRAG